MRILRCVVGLEGTFLAQPSFELNDSEGVASGKSTLMGHWLVQLGYVSSKQLHKLERDAAAIKMGSRSQGIIREQPSGSLQSVFWPHSASRVHRKGLQVEVGMKCSVPRMDSFPKVR